MNRLMHLNAINDVEVLDGNSEAFKTYGRIVHGFHVDELIHYMKENTMIPDNGNVYVPSVHDLECFPVIREIQNEIFGEMPIQVGYCNGKNSTYNGVEYHKCTEINIACNDFMLVLGHVWDIEENHYNFEKAQVFYFEKGSIIEMYGTTLHMSPLKISEDGFRDIVILPKGTNTPLQENKSMIDSENTLLLQKNKWVITHRDRKPLVDQGAYQGIIGENKELKF